MLIIELKAFFFPRKLNLIHICKTVSCPSHYLILYSILPYIWTQSLYNKGYYLIREKTQIRCWTLVTKLTEIQAVSPSLSHCCSFYDSLWKSVCTYLSSCRVMFALVSLAAMLLASTGDPSLLIFFPWQFSWGVANSLSLYFPIITTFFQWPQRIEVITISWHELANLAICPSPSNGNKKCMRSVSSSVKQKIWALSLLDEALKW